MKLSIIIPVYNEEKTIEEVLKRVKRAPCLNYEKEIIIVDDGSTDNLKLREPSAKIVRHRQNLGKGAAIRTGLGLASGEAVIIQDADLEYDPEDWQKMLKKFDGESAVYGSRNINPKRKGYFHCVLGVKFLTGLTNLLFQAKLTDIYTCYKLMPLEIIKSLDLKSNGFEIEAEMTAKLLKKRVKIKEVPISYNPRQFKEGKKIRVKDGIIGFWTILTNF